AAEKMIADMGDKLAASDKASVEAAVETLKTAINANDVDGMTKGMEQLTQAQHKAAESLYKQAGTSPGRPGTEGASGSPGAGPTGAPESAGGTGDVIDAEVVDDK